MDEFNRTHWEENEPIRVQWLLLFATNSATSTVPGEKDSERKNELRNMLLFYSFVNTFCSSFSSHPLSFYQEHLFFLHYFLISLLRFYCKQQQLVRFICGWNFLNFKTHILTWLLHQKLCSSIISDQRSCIIWQQFKAKFSLRSALESSLVKCRLWMFGLMFDMFWAKQQASQSKSMKSC